MKIIEEGEKIIVMDTEDHIQILWLISMTQ